MSHSAKLWAHALMKQCHPPGGSESLPTSKRLWQNDDELRALEAFALAGDRKTAIDALKKDGQSSIQSDIFGVMLALQSNRVEDAEVISNQIAEKMARTTDEDFHREAARWEVVLKEMDLQASLKAWDNPSKRKDVLSKLSETLGLTFKEHEQDASYRRRAEAAAGDTGPQYPSSISAEAKAEKLTGFVEAWIDVANVQSRQPPLAPEVLMAIVSSEAVMSHLKSKKPQVIRSLLNQVSKLSASWNTAAIPGLMRLIAEDFQISSANGEVLYFGQEDIHTALTLDQMHELAAAHPPVLGMATFLAHIATMLHELNCGSSTEPSVEERASFLNALQELLKSAPDSANWLRAQCLCSLLRLQREQTGWACPATLSELLRLPRRVLSPWMPNAAQTSRSQRTAPQCHEEQCKAQSPECDTVQPLSDLPGLGSGNFTMEELKAWMTDAVMAPDGGPQHFEKGSGLLAGVLDAETERRIVASAMLLAGKGNTLDWTSALKAAGGDPRGLAATTHLRFSPDCQKAFMPGEEVTLKLDAKNCRSLMVKVFEINTWNFCMDNNLEEVGADIELEGLGATHSFSVSLADLPATQRKRLEVPIPQLTGRRGSFVVELMGGGLACRSLLRIGRLSAVQDLVASGHSFQLLWEDGTLVEKPKVWVDNTEYTPEGESRSVVVPFSTCGTLRQAALLGCQDGDMAQVMHFVQRAEEYLLEASMFMEKESLVPQAQAPLVVWASVRLNGMAVPISRLYDACLFVSVVDTEGTRSEQKFEVNTASPGKGREEPLMLELKEMIGMPEDPVSVEARLVGSIRMIGQSNVQTGQQEVQKLVAIDSWRDLGVSSEGAAALHGIYLSRANGGHILSVKGRAGEPVKDAVLKVTLYAGSLGPAVCDQEVTCSLQTDEHGEVELGDLQGFSDLLVELRSTPSRNTSSCMQEFKLLPLKPVGESAPPARLNIQANNETPVRIPYSAAPAVRVSVFGEALECRSQPSLCQIPGSFSCMVQQKALKDVSSVCLSAEPGYLLLRNVPPGRYRLCLSSGSNIIVHATSTFNGGVLSRPESKSKWMLARDSIASASDDHPLQICGLSASATGGVLVQLGGSEAALKEATVSVCLTRFLPPKGDGARADSPLLPLSSPAGIAAFDAGAPVEEHRILPPSGGELVLERHLSEEVRYILERRQMLSEGPACPGSILQPPSLLIHPQQRSQSDSRSRELHSDMEKCLKLRARCGEATSDLCARPCMLGGGGNMSAQIATRCLHSFVPAPLLLSGLKPGPDGAVRVSAPELLPPGGDLASSGHFLVAARAVSPCHGASCAWVEVQGACSPSSAPVVATCPPRPFEPGSCCVETRRVAVLWPEQVQTLADPGNLRLRVLDSLPKVWDHLGSLLSEPQAGLFAGSKDKASEAWRKLDFIAHWPSLSRAQKLNHLAEHPCHELHFYIAVNDTELFREAIQPLLAAKHPLERGFMDDWLLLCPTSIRCLQEEEGREAAQEMVQRWGSPGRLAELNAAERILLAMLSDALEITAVPALANELRDLARLYASKPTNERVIEQQRLSSRRRFAAALRAGGDGKGSDNPGGGHPTAPAPTHRPRPTPPPPPPPPAAIEALSLPLMAKKKAKGGAPAASRARPRGFMAEMAADEEEAGPWEDELVDEEDTDDDSFVEVEGEGGSSEESGEEDKEDDENKKGDSDGSKGAAGGGGGDWLEELLTAKRPAPRRFQRPGPTKKWFESGWAGSSGGGASSRVSPHVAPNEFWADVALQLAERLEEAVDIAQFNYADGVDAESSQLLLLGRPLVSRHLLEALDNQQAALGYSINPLRSNSSNTTCGFTAALLAVSFMAMPERPGCSVAREPQTRALTIKAATPGLAFVQEMLVVPPRTHQQEAATNSGLTIIRRLCEEGAKEGEQVEGPLEAGRLYRYEVVISSALPTATVLDVLVAIPKGSLPEDAKPSKGTIPCRVNPYGSRMIQAKFYFPYPAAEAGQYPVTAVSPEGELLANSVDEAPLQVLERLPPKAAPAKTDNFDWTELSQGGTDEEVLEFLETGNLSEGGIDLEKVAWRARERPDFLSGALTALRRRRVFDRRLWQYALLHSSQDDAAVREALSLFPELCHLVGPCFDSRILSVDPRDSGVSHMELWPLVNPRAHPLPEPALDQALTQMAGRQSSKHVFNSDLQQAWGCLLSVIARRAGGPSPAEAVSAAYYLVLQERLAEAREVLESHGGSVGGTPEALGMQRDYMLAWLALRQPGAGPSKDQLEAAWDSCKRHLQPGSATASNPRWCRRWEELAETLVVLRGSGIASSGLHQGTGPLVAGPGHTALQPVPLLTVRPMGGWTLEVVAEALEVEEIQVRIFPMDAEVLFSTSPFSIANHGAEGAMGSEAGLGKFSIVAPSATMRIPAPLTSEPQTVDISGILPGMEESGAVMVQLTAGGASCSIPVYSGGLRARGNAREGILYVSQRIVSKGGASEDSAGWAPASAAYCKVYCKDPCGSERFYKDGYTDVLGRFNYASISGAPSSTGGGRIYEMAALVVSPQVGCAIVKLGAPAGLR